MTARRVRVTQAQRDSLVAGQTLALQYLPGDPTTERFRGWERQSSTTTWSLLVIATLSGTAFGLQRKSKRESRLRRAAVGPRKDDGPPRPGDPRR